MPIQNPETLAQIQSELAQKVQISQGKNGFYPKSDNLIFTLDVQYQENIAFTALDVRTLSGQETETFIEKYEVETDYISGFFGFREAPILIQMINYILKKYNFTPKLLVIDGHGLAHPRKFGVACHVGVELGIPTIGVAKNPLLKYEGNLGKERGDFLPILLDNEEVGRVLRTQNGIKPIFVSVGHLMSLENAMQIVLQLASKYRQPEPIRRADHQARAFAKENQKG